MAVAAEKVGYSVGAQDTRYRELLLDLLSVALEPLALDEAYDFGASTMPARLSEMGQSASEFSDFWHAPPSDVVYFHRKVGGMFMLASRMKARVNAHALMQEWM